MRLSFDPVTNNVPPMVPIKVTKHIIANTPSIHSDTNEVSIPDMRFTLSSFDNAFQLPNSSTLFVFKLSKCSGASSEQKKNLLPSDRLIQLL